MKARPASGGPTCILQDRSGWGNRVGACDNQRCAIAIRNLDAQIAGYAWQAVEQRSSVADRAALVGLITLRGHLRGRIVDYERASVPPTTRPSRAAAAAPASAWRQADMDA